MAQRSSDLGSGETFQAELGPAGERCSTTKTQPRSILAARLTQPLWTHKSTDSAPQPLRAASSGTILKAAATSGDAFEHFGRYIAAKLRNLPRHQGALAEQLVQYVILEAEMGQLTKERYLLHLQNTSIAPPRPAATCTTTFQAQPSGEDASSPEENSSVNHVSDDHEYFQPSVEIGPSNSPEGVQEDMEELETPADEAEHIKQYKCSLKARSEPGQSAFCNATEVLWLREEERVLIDCVRRHPCIWDVRVGDFRLKSKKWVAWQAIWTEVAKKKPFVTLWDVKKKWVAVKTRFRRLRKMMADKKDGEARSRRDPWLRQLAFMEESYKAREAAAAALNVTSPLSDHQSYLLPQTTEQGTVEIVGTAVPVTSGSGAGRRILIATMTGEDVVTLTTNIE